TKITGGQWRGRLVPERALAPLELRNTRNGALDIHALPRTRTDRPGSFRCRGSPSGDEPGHCAFVFHRPTDLQGGRGFGLVRPVRQAPGAVRHAALEAGGP